MAIIRKKNKPKQNQLIFTHLKISAPAIFYFIWGKISAVLNRDNSEKFNGEHNQQ